MGKKYISELIKYTLNEFGEFKKNIYDHSNIIKKKIKLQKKLRKRNKGLI